MLNESDLIVVVCPNCHQKSQKQIGWIRNHAHFRCGCGRLLEYNYDKFLEFLREEATYPGAEFHLVISPMDSAT